MSKHLSYRPEIDGLRTVAVLAVIAFHLQKSWLQGGFLGVDVFFVISGFLITTIIHSQLIDDQFSLLQFWKRRIRRLFPALMAMVVGVLIMSWFVMAQPYRGDLAQQAIGALISVQNLLLWKTTSGYWSSSSDHITFLHTWSLSLEEQFYMVFPIILMCLRRFARRRELIVLSLMGIASFALCVVATPSQRSAAFYLLPTRMWELLLGGVYAVYRIDAIQRADPPTDPPTDPQTGPQTDSSSLGTWLRKLAPWLQVVGLAMILWSFYAIQNDRRFPGYQPLVPCVGTLLLIVFGEAASPVKSILASGPFVYLGKLSYSLYLWHWPVIVLLRCVSTKFSYPLAVVLTFVAAMLSYHFVESRLRFTFSKRQLIGGLVATGACLLPLVFFRPFLSPADLGNLHDTVALTRGAEFEANGEINAGRPGLTITPRGDQDDRIDLCVIGSSHGRVLMPPIANYAKQNSLSLTSMAMSEIGLIEEVPTRKRLKHIKQLRPRATVLAGAWSYEQRKKNFVDMFTESVRELASSSDKVIVVGQIPLVELPDEYQRALQKYMLAQRVSEGKLELNASATVPEANRQVEALLSDLGLNNVQFVSPYDLFLDCDDGRVEIVRDGEMLYADFYHVNNAGAQIVFDRIIHPALPQSVNRQ